MSRIDISRDDINHVVASFYAKIRQHPVLGAVFAHSISAPDWPAHEEKISRFWASAILAERSYSGNPMQVHKNQGHIQEMHFALWLGLFDQTLYELLEKPQADQFSALAHRIGASLKMGMMAHLSTPDRVPNLA